jgi:hypothetical protein
MATDLMGKGLEQERKSENISSVRLFDKKQAFSSEPTQ